MLGENSKLAAAAEELIKAVSNHIESSSTVEELKKLSLDVTALKGSFDDKINTVVQSIGTLKDAIVAAAKAQEVAIAAAAKAQEVAIAAQDMRERLEWGITNSQIGYFKYHEQGEYNVKDSAALVKQVLIFFRKGQGMYIQGRSITDYRAYNNNVEEGEKKFRDALAAQIHDLLGVKPRVAKGADRVRYAIFYS